MHTRICLQKCTCIEPKWIYGNFCLNSGVLTSDVVSLGRQNDKECRVSAFVRKKAGVGASGQGHSEALTASILYKNQVLFLLTKNIVIRFLLGVHIRVRPIPFVSL